jgi:hypothetical protein
MNAIVLGGGGPKSKEIRAWQEDEKLESEVRFIMQIATLIFKKMQSGDIHFSTDGKQLEGDLIIKDNEE